MTKKTKTFTNINEFVVLNKGKKKAEMFEVPDNYVSIAPENGIMVKDSQYVRDMIGKTK